MHIQLKYNHWACLQIVSLFLILFFCNYNGWNSFFSCFFSNFGWSKCFFLLGSALWGLNMIFKSFSRLKYVCLLSYWSYQFCTFHCVSFCSVSFRYGLLCLLRSVVIPFRILQKTYDKCHHLHLLLYIVRLL